MKVRHGSGDDRSHSHHAPSPHDQIAADDAARADRRPFAHQRRPRVLVRVRTAASATGLAIVARGKRSLVNIVPALIITPSSIVTAAQM